MIENLDRKEYWNQIYQTKKPKERSWFQSVPEVSLECIESFKLDKNVSIIDIGGGDAHLVDTLLVKGYKKITILDVSDIAIKNAQKRLGKKAAHVNWVRKDIMAFQPQEKYDVWHDRATFHFLVENQDIVEYISMAWHSLKPNGILILGTFSDKGPDQCSGLKVHQYSEAAMTNRLSKYFNKVRCFTMNHKTPFGTIQNFLFCSFIKK